MFCYTIYLLYSSCTTNNKDTAQHTILYPYIVLTTAGDLTHTRSRRQRLWTSAVLMRAQRTKRWKPGIKVSITIHWYSTLTTAVPTFPSPPPKNRRKVSCAAMGVADERKMTFLRSPVYLHVGTPLQSVSYSNFGVSHCPLIRCMTRVGLFLSSTRKPAV